MKQALYLFDASATENKQVLVYNMTRICTAWNTSTSRKALKKKKKKHRIHLVVKHKHAFGIHKCWSLVNLNNTRVAPSSQHWHFRRRKVIGLKNTVLVLTAPRQTCPCTARLLFMALPGYFKALCVLCKMSCATFLVCGCNGHSLPGTAIWFPRLPFTPRLCF